MTGVAATRSPKSCDEMILISGGARKTVTDEAMALLQGYAWPGNVRQLRNEIQRACALSDRVILPEVLGDDVRHRSVPVAPSPPGGTEERTWLASASAARTVPSSSNDSVPARPVEITSQPRASRARAMKVAV